MYDKEGSVTPLHQEAIYDLIVVNLQVLHGCILSSLAMGRGEHVVH